MTTNQLTADVFDRFALRDEFLGFGYIGERRHFAEAEVAPVDALVLEVASQRGWDEDRLFQWANSKDGRWFADCALGCNDTVMARRYI